MEVIVPETRGSKPKYDFSQMQIGASLSFKDTNTRNVLNSAKSYCTRKGLSWQFRCYTMDQLTYIVRIK